MLLRAFGPPNATFSPTVDPGEVLSTARSFQMTERIAARAGARLAAEIGGEAAAAFSLALRRSVVNTMRLSALLGTVTQTAARLDLPVVLLKFAALEARKQILAGSRPAADIDVLVPASRAEELQAALSSTGLVPGDFEPCDHHLVPLRSPAGGAVELHHRLPGVRLRGRRSVGAEELLDSGRVARLPGFPGECYAPSEEVHAAYLIVHGFVQHGPFPRTYSLLRVLGDLIDLSGSPGAEVPLRSGEIHALIGREMGEPDVAEILGLCALLKEGKHPENSPLLTHILARTLSGGYQEKLVLRTLVPLSDEPKAAVFLRSAYRKLIPTTAHLDAVYGPRASRLGYLVRRLNRPLDLLRRLWRARKPVEIGDEINENPPRSTGKGSA